MSGNDYLGLSGERRVIEAAAGATSRWGAGATGSRLMSGHLELHEQLEADLAAMTGYESAIVFGSGFLCNIGVLSTLAAKGICFADRLVHASLVDGMRLGGGRFFRFVHNDVAHLTRLMDEHPDAERNLIVTESVFSMDGDLAPLSNLAKTAIARDAILVVDEAHAIGVFGYEGGGVHRCVSGDAEIRPDVLLGTCSKAIGSYGGFVCCESSLRDFFINYARSFIYSTALPPGCLAASRESIAIIREAEHNGKPLGAMLLAKATRFREMLMRRGVCPMNADSQIVPVLIGENEAAIRVSEQLRERGVVAVAIRPPTVPRGTARLRLSVSLAHDDERLDEAAGVIAEVLLSEGVQLS